MSQRSVHNFHDHQVEELTPHQFDFDEIDRALISGDPNGIAARELAEAWKSEEKCGQSAEVLSRLIDLLLPDKLNKLSAKASGVKLLALGWMVQAGSGRIGSLPLSAIAKRTGMTRAILSYWVRHFEEHLGFHARAQKLSGSVASYEASAVTGWETRRANAAKKADGDPPPILTPEVGHEANHSEGHLEQP